MSKKEIMEHVLITYDLSKGHSVIKAGLQIKGYEDYWTSSLDNTTYYLPNTTLWKERTSLDQAVKDIKSVIATENKNRPNYDQISLQRCITVHANPWSGIPGNPHGS